MSQVGIEVGGQADLSGEDEAARAAVLATRAERLALAGDRDLARAIVAEIAVLGAGAERFGVPARAVRAIAPLPTLTRLPGLPAWMLGIATFSGEILSVIDLGAWLEVERCGAPAFVAWIATLSGGLGLAVEAVHGFRAVHDDEIADATTGVRSPMASAMTRDLVSLLQPALLAGRPELLVRGGA